MPVGNDTTPDLLPTPEQRESIYHKIRRFRETKSIFAMDFQNDAEYVGVMPTQKTGLILQKNCGYAAAIDRNLSDIV